VDAAKGFNLLEGRDVHIHFPAGAVPKDGPSAGVTLVTSLVSLFTQKSVRSDTAMTGEMTLRGLVLPVGGVKDKVKFLYLHDLIGNFLRQDYGHYDSIIKENKENPCFRIKSQEYSGDSRLS